MMDTGKGLYTKKAEDRVFSDKLIETSIYKFLPNEVMFALGENGKVKCASLWINEQQEKIDKLTKALELYASFETQYASDNERPMRRCGDGFEVDDYDYAEGHFKQYGKLARQTLKEIK